MNDHAINYAMFGGNYIPERGTVGATVNGNWRVLPELMRWMAALFLPDYIRLCVLIIRNVSK